MRMMCCCRSCFWSLKNYWATERLKKMNVQSKKPKNLIYEYRSPALRLSGKGAGLFRCWDREHPVGRGLCIPLEWFYGFNIAILKVRGKLMNETIARILAHRTVRDFEDRALSSEQIQKQLSIVPKRHRPQVLFGLFHHRSHGSRQKTHCRKSRVTNILLPRMAISLYFFAPIFIATMWSERWRKDVADSLESTGHGQRGRCIPGCPECSFGGWSDGARDLLRRRLAEWPRKSQRTPEDSR